MVSIFIENFDRIHIDDVADNITNTIANNLRSPFLSDILDALKGYEEQLKSQAEEPEIDVLEFTSQINQLKQLVSSLSQKNTELALENSELVERIGKYEITQWQEIMNDLDAVGFYQYTGDAVAAARQSETPGESTVVQNAIADLKSNALAGNIKGVKFAYYRITRSLKPTEEQKAAFQSVLDKYKISKKLIKFA